MLILTIKICLQWNVGSLTAHSNDDFLIFLIANNANRLACLSRIFLKRQKIRKSSHRRIIISTVETRQNATPCTFYAFLQLLISQVSTTKESLKINCKWKTRRDAHWCFSIHSLLLRARRDFHPFLNQDLRRWNVQINNLMGTLSACLFYFQDIQEFHSHSLHL